VLPGGIPDKGEVLNRLSAFWFEKTSHIVPNHFIEVVEDIRQLDERYPNKGNYPLYLTRRSMLVRKAERIPVECVVRGYLAGSAWAEYYQKGSICDITLPPGLKECQELPHPVFTPTTKAESGHDVNLTAGELAELVSEERAQELKEKTISIYRFAEQYARTRNIIIADTKMEFGIIEEKMLLIDELLTPDSSRFWDANTYEVGHPQPSFDKQPLRDWLTASGWNKEPPAPELPPEVIEQTSQRYKEAYRRLTGRVI
jgi:phosphoribosylaminoimidazole-succinocarboxamide synthase